MSVEGIVVRPAESRDVRRASGVLADAFAHDPPFVWMLPDEASRRRRLCRYFITEMRHEAMRFGGVELVCVGTRIVGAAIWLPPDHWISPPAQQLLLVPGFVWAFGRRLGVASTVAQATVRVHPRTPHWYLQAVGIAPDHQGSGIGTALLRSRLTRCDSDRTPAYLESSKPENVPFYEKLGFRTVGTIAFPDGAPTVTPMWRAGTSGVGPERCALGDYGTSANPSEV